MFKTNPTTEYVRDDGTLYFQGTGDTTSDLPTTVNGFKPGFGSLILIGTAGDFYYYNGSSWVKVGS